MAIKAEGALSFAEGGRDLPIEVYGLNEVTVWGTETSKSDPIS